MPGFESNRFIDLSECVAKHFSCDICLNIFNNPIVSECQHSFCKDCVHTLIENNHKSCPQCRHPFATRKRPQSSRSDDNVVIVGNYTFKRNLIVNNFINDFKIKCNFEFNGCKEVIELGLLSAHLRQCEHRFCKMCGINVINDEQHRNSCLELLKNQKFELEEKVTKLERVVNSYEEKEITNDNNLRELRELVFKAEEVINNFMNEKKTNINTIKVLKEENTFLKNETSSLEEQKITNENEMRDLREKLTTLEEVVKNYIKEKKTNVISIKVLREGNTLLKDKTTNENKIRELEAKISTLEEVVKRYEKEKKTNENTIKMLNEKIPYVEENQMKSITKLSLPIDLKYTYLLFGGFSGHSLNVIFRSDAIIANSVSYYTNSGEKVNILIQINWFEEVFCLFDKPLPTLMIRLDLFGRNCINENLKSIYPANYGDPLNDSNQFIVFVFKNEFKQIVTEFVNHCKNVAPNIKNSVLKAKEAEDMIERLDLGMDLFALEVKTAFPK